VTPDSGPQPFQHVMLDVPGLGRLEARVEWVADGNLTLALFMPLESELGPWDELEAMIEFTSERGLHRIEGLVREAGPEADVLDFERRIEPALVQRRQYARADAVIPVRVWSDGGEELDAFTLNVSGGGLLLNGGEALSIGDVVWFELELGDVPLGGRARVVREDADGGRGLQIDVPEKGRDRLVRFVFDRHRKERLVRRS
jgi:c-di-GMP-binding flagellar brake protein YcgR